MFVKIILFLHSEQLKDSYTLTFVEQHTGLVHIQPRSIELQPKVNKTYNVLLVGQEPGSLVVAGELWPNDTLR